MSYVSPQFWLTARQPADFLGATFLGATGLSGTLIPNSYFDPVRVVFLFTLPRAAARSLFGYDDVGAGCKVQSG